MDKIYVRIVDADGLFVRDDFVESLVDENGDPIQTYIETPCPDRFYWPRWDGAKWVEGGTAPEPSPLPIDELTMTQLAIADLAEAILGGAL